ncbi:MAG: pyridoxal 5'-phosphate synthase glutaminase subunit PdxT [Bowdeniella nasicola]|nr:pyridoxal 5'-phosphate synthase glutaminase subunit PdxT [Bowdeniella nasicola]
MSAPRIGVLAVQGAFAEHTALLRQLGCDVVDIRKTADLEDFDALVFPGGESTTQRRLIHDLGLYQPLREALTGGTPALATCAGMILLAREVREGRGSGVSEKDAEFARRFPTLGVMPVVVERNAYGRQLGSFKTVTEMRGVGPVEATFIRAPFIADADASVEVLARVDGKTVAAQSGALVALSFHPELDTDAVHRWFLQEVVAA